MAGGAPMPRTAMLRGGASACVMNGSHEVALDAFIAGQIGFLDMARLVGEAMESLDGLPEANDLDDIFETDAQARRVGWELVKRFAA